MAKVINPAARVQTLILRSRILGSAVEPYTHSCHRAAKTSQQMLWDRRAVSENSILISVERSFRRRSGSRRALAPIASAMWTTPKSSQKGDLRGDLRE